MACCCPRLSPKKLGEKLSEITDQASGGGVLCRFRQEGDTQVCDAGTAGHLFRIAHEAIRNALKHAKPGHVDISLVGSVLAIELIVEDDGVGISVDSLRNGSEIANMGLRIMSNRAAFIGATLTINPSRQYGINRGTTIICRLPRAQVLA